MGRGFVVSEYKDDEGIFWRLKVDADDALDPDRGWYTGLTPGLTPLPRLWSPRYVVGVDQTGRLCQTRVSSVEAPLWTGSATAFWHQGNDGLMYSATVIRRVGERRRL